MLTPVLQMNHISKTYKEHQALDGVSFTIQQGEIYGFIGQNGAGKTTLIRIVTGLSYPTNGSFALFGAAEESQKVKARKRIGAIIETPALYGHMTAADNLEVLRLQKGIPGKACIEKNLKLVGLAHTGNKKVKNFSLGMRQRLAIAGTLLGDPEFLILDEPTNGLDPTGIREIRNLLLKLNREHRLTILISSHILSELHMLATRFGIIHQGRMIEELSIQELNEKCQKHLRIKVDDPKRASIVLETKLKSNNFEVLSDGTLKLYQYTEEPHMVSTALVKAGLVIEEFTPTGDDLETYYTRLIGGEPRV
ncbi:ATP-binding cassette domain-containing protein [Lederbergia sp. NSJ-179]|uniref:ATP-binding cassette domain-containing protein n=1 Tax=Lederbergia sp. NSJ-179 TaxID=2931402 RepID=UPI001FD17B03|nr:ATP-binding cassette domain-containing protein [Lederbergia sp. NSJ-179]MCJ7843452.1 ATP-binding cassette domain-containing protein [Lederbergia sp. NSJ-179]